MDRKNKGFSLIEMMVVASTVSVVMAVTMPALLAARAKARAIVCRSNVRQLVLANMEYSNDHDGFCVPAAMDLWNLFPETFQAGYNRWHGKRNGPNEPFDPLKGPLAEYLGDGKVKECPEKVDFIKNQPGFINFELGCGGYGYNLLYIGSRLWECKNITYAEQKKAYGRTTNITEIKRPDTTLMFADTAFYKNNQYLIEYSFAEPPYFVNNRKIRENILLSPSIHFRHRDSSNVGWADGHIEPKPMAERSENNHWKVDSAEMKLGWFEPVDNSWFDLE